MTRLESIGSLDRSICGDYSTYSSAAFLVA